MSVFCGESSLNLFVNRQLTGMDEIQLKAPDSFVAPVKRGPCSARGFDPSSLAVEPSPLTGDADQPWASAILEVSLIGIYTDLLPSKKIQGECNISNRFPSSYRQVCQNHG
jgi:hypothetical protein